MSLPTRSDTVDLGEVLLTLIRGWVWILAGLLVGLLMALAVIRFGPIRYEAVASVTLRDRTEGGSSPLRMGGQLGEGLASLLALPSQLAGDVETEEEILQSRVLIEEVVEGASLQVEVRAPRHIGADSLFSRISVNPTTPKAVYSFRSSGDAISVSGGDVDRQVAPGGTVELPGLSLTLVETGLPESFKIRVLPAQQVVDGIMRKGRLSAEITGGDLAEVVFIARDARTASRAVNLAVELYLEDRLARTRGLTEARYGVLDAISDSLRTDLSRATGEMREYLEEESVFDPERLGDLERAAALRAGVDQLRVEAHSLDEVLSRMTSDSVVATDILAYPSFLASEAINDVLARIFTLESERMELLKRRTDQDADVRLLGETLEYLEGELVALARSYRTGLERQLTQMQSELSDYRADLSSRPAQEERRFELEKEIERLTASYVGVQAQQVQAKLAAIGQGADLRQIDVPPPPRKPKFPVTWITLAIGLLAGAVMGSTGALVADAASGTLRSIWEAGAATGVPAVSLSVGAPFLVLGEGEKRTVLVIPVGAGVSAAQTARRIGESLSARGEVLSVDAEGDPAAGEKLAEGEAVGRRTVVACSNAKNPGTLALVESTRAVLLVAELRRTRVDELVETVNALGRAGIGVSGVVVPEA